MNLTPIITTAGLNAVINATNDGLNAKIVSIVLGDMAWEPDVDAIELRNERARIPITGSTRVSTTQIHLTAIENGEVEYWVREIGFVLDDGTLLAVWSQPDQDRPLAYKAPSIDLLVGFDLVLSALPAGSVVVEDNGGLNLGPATTTISGVVRLATEAEAIESKRRDVAISPAGVALILERSLSDAIKEATLEEEGVARFANYEESLAGDDANLIISPAMLKRVGQKIYQQYIEFGPVQTTGYINTLDGLADFTAPAGSVMVGINSTHDNRTEDRRFRIRYQTIKTTNKPPIINR